MMLSDYHMHTEFSLDSEAVPEEMAESAAAKGLAAVCITDHEDKDNISEGNNIKLGIVKQSADSCPSFACAIYRNISTHQ